ncbi:YitT family protein [Salicibibacter cibarius]|uniref:YitT family protein n=1 Tax=Salicibibacter cibarius TaxID=2743000 RepID=A0A7T6Z3T9_9BACI|nr:YitT family protein [Salicibibacter cibarius]QQK76212.1 YitT family protein [Salicibibacter cibarius]
MFSTKRKESIARFIYRCFMVTCGAILTAVAIQLFLIPNSVIDGGVIGVSLILNELTGLGFGILVLVINIPFLLFGLKQVGTTFFLTSLYGIVILAITEQQLHQFTTFIHEPMITTLFGGFILGAGIGIVIRYGGALDGTEILGILLTKNVPFSVGEFIMFINIFIFTWAGFVFGWEQAMLSVITYFVASKTIDAVIQGIDETKAVVVVSNKYAQLSSAVVHRLGRSLTVMDGQGAFTHSDKEVLYIVVTRLEVMKLKSIVFEIDKEAFITVMNAQEVHGGKFKSDLH